RPFLGSTCRDFIFERGLVSGATVHAAEFLERAAEWQQLTPFRNVHLVECGREAIAEMASSPALRSLSSLRLTFSAKSSDGDLALLCASQLLGKLTELDLSFTSAGEACANAIAANEALSRLRTLRLVRSGVRVGAMELLAQARHLHRLETLDVSNTRIGG